MSDHTTRDLYIKPRYFHRHVGGVDRPENNHQYVMNQSELIQKSKLNLPPPNLGGIYGGYGGSFGGSGAGIGSHGQFRNPKSAISRSINTTGNTNSSHGFGHGLNTTKGIYIRSEEIDKKLDRYEPYTGFLHKKGLLDDGTNRRRFRTHYIDINSRFRVTNPSLTVDDSILLSENPLDFAPNSNLVFVRHSGHAFENGDLITMTGVLPKQVTVRTFNDLGSPSFDIPRNCNFMKVFVPHDLPSSYSGTQIQVELKNIRGDRGTVATSSFLGNIPVNNINAIFPLRLTLDPTTDLDEDCDFTSLLSSDPTYFDYDPNYFFVILPKTMHDPSSAPAFVLKEYNYKVAFLSISGIPINELNANYPISPETLNGYHEVKNVVENGYTIEVSSRAVLDSTQDINGGGGCVSVAKVLSVFPGYPNPNNYIIDLGDTFHDIISARLVSMEFPNSENSIRNFPPERVNNKIYWNDIDDGDFTYTIEVPPGNYTPAELKAVMENLFVNTPRVNAGEDIGATYTPSHFIQVNINENTNETTFRSFKEFVLSEPIEEVVPRISEEPALDGDLSETDFRIRIDHQGHGMTRPGERILIQNAISHLGIPSTTLNQEHVVESIVDDDTYIILLPRFNLGDGREFTKGGVNVFIYIPDQFRLLFDQPDTLGEVLGFRTPGDPNSITPFSSFISNNDQYAFDITQNALGETIQISNNFLQFSGDNYVIMVANPLETFSSIGPIKRGFAKIILCDIPGKVLYNSFVPTSKFYEDPLHELSELEIMFYASDGSLYDFNGVEHSFTLEIVTVHDIPEGSGISANTGRNYNIVS